MSVDRPRFPWAHRPLGHGASARVRAHHPADCARRAVLRARKRRVHPAARLYRRTARASSSATWSTTTSRSACRSASRSRPRRSIRSSPPRYAAAGSYFAFTVLPTIIFFSSFMTVLYYLKVMQWVVKAMAWVMQRTMRTSGAETLSATGNIFLGQTEAPLMIKPFVQKMTMSELHCVMTAGFATVAGGVMAAYVGMLVAVLPGHRRPSAGGQRDERAGGDPDLQGDVPRGRGAGDEGHAQGRRPVARRQRRSTRPRAGQGRAVAWRSTSAPCCSRSSRSSRC